MKSRHVFWLLLICFTFSLPDVFAKNLELDSSQKKVFIILRTGQDLENLQNFKSLVASSLEINQVFTQFETYKISEQVPQMKIFKRAYKENFDYILLIDQIANINIDLSNNKVNVGGKYQIQSYYLKSANPSWKNHGDANCNVAIKESVREFSNKIISTISIDEFSDMEYVTSASENIESHNYFIQPEASVQEIVIPELKLKEVLLLKTQIALEKTKTNRVLNEIELLILKTEKQLLAETEKNKLLQLEIQKLRKSASL